MARNANLLEPLELKSVSGRWAFDVPWEKAEAIQDHLRRHGVGATLRVDDLIERRAHLELWEEISPQQLQEILDQWQGP
jgi:hypothetical protein